MSTIIILLIASISMAILFLGAFVYSAKNGQFDDAYTPSIRMLKDNEKKQETTKPTINQES